MPETPAWKAVRFDLAPTVPEVITPESVLGLLGGPPAPPASDDHPADPGEDWWHGHFFPGQPSRDTGTAWRREATTFAMRVRHLPSRRVLLAVEREFGAAGIAACAGWRDLWSGCEDVDALSARTLVGREAALWDGEVASRKRGFLAVSRGDVRAAAVEAMSRGTMAEPDPEPVRSLARHALEDCSVHLALAATGMPYGLELAVADDEVRRYAPGADGRLRRLMPESVESARVEAGMRAAYGGPQPYWQSRAFLARAGRGVCVVRGHEAMAATLVDMAAQGHALAFVKAVRIKGGTWTVDLRRVVRGGDAVAAFASAMGAATAEVFGAHPFMVQGHVPFTSEHRFLVVRHRVVASTASVRALSVLDAVSSRIVHPHVATLVVPPGAAGAYDRGEQALVPDRALAARMARGARDLARAFAREGVHADAYCIDMGGTADGRVLPIEVNGLASCGLYAAPWARVATALAARWRAASAAGADGTRVIETRQYVLRWEEAEHVPDSPSDLAAEGARRLHAKAVTVREAPRLLGFVRDFAPEIRAYAEDAFGGGDPAAFEEALALFDPMLHKPWRDRYADWLRDLGGRRAARAMGEASAVAAAGGQVEFSRPMSSSDWEAMLRSREVDRFPGEARPGVSLPGEALQVRFRAEAARIDAGGSALERCGRIVDDPGVLAFVPGTSLEVLGATRGPGGEPVAIDGCPVATTV